MIAKFFYYKMSYSVGSQVKEIQLIFHDMIIIDIVVIEVFQMPAMIEKLPHFNIDFKNYVKHKRRK